MGILDILKQYTNPAATPAAEVNGHFDTVAQEATPASMGSGIAAAMRSDATPPFSQTVGNLFGQSNPDQKAGVLNEILQALGPAGLAAAGGGMLGRILGGTQTPGTTATITPTQAAQVSPSEVSTMAASAEQQNGSIVDRLGSFYAQHPALVKTLGVAALGAVMSHMNTQQRV